MIIGIDLGTTNSLVSVWREGKAELIPNALGDYLTPSVVGFSDDNAVLVGRAARDRLITHPDKTQAVFKRYMGSNREMQIAGRKMRAEELSALVLQSLKADAEAHLGETVVEAVVTVPAYFSDAQRKATKVAGELAGLTIKRLVNEPTAAALAYGLHEGEDESQFLVFDLGGGTFDISVLELFSGVMEVHACSGDNFLGGEDFVTTMQTAFCDKHGLKGDDVDASLREQIRSAAEVAKRQLSERSQVEMSVNVRGEALTMAFDEASFEKLCQPLLDRLRTPIETALRDANIRAAELDAVVMVGGSTKMPVVQRMASRLFGRLPLRTINPDEVVGMGAAVQAGLIARDASLEEVVMTDVCPYTLGTGVSRQVGVDRWESGFFNPIIERNTIIPASRVDSLWPIKKGQSGMMIDVYQGEAPMVKDNIYLGKLDVPLPTDVEPQDAGVDVRFSYDSNGLLEVEVTVQKTGEKSQLVIEQNPGLLTEEQIAERLEALKKIKMHPRDDVENQTVLARAERLYAQTLGDQRDYVSRWLARFRSVLDGQDPTEIRTTRRDIIEAMDEIERDTWL